MDFPNIFVTSVTVIELPSDSDEFCDEKSVFFEKHKTSSIVFRVAFSWDTSHLHM